MEDSSDNEKATQGQNPLSFLVPRQGLEPRTY